jgi:hypothetical protein
MSDHIPDLTKMIGETPRTDQMEQHAPVGLRRNAAFEQASDLCRHLERELAAANRRIEALNRGNAAAERILCEAAGVGSGRDVLDWIVAAKDRIKRLEEVGDELSDCADQIGWTSCESSQWIKKAENAVKEWHKAKEAKP